MENKVEIDRTSIMKRSSIMKKSVVKEFKRVRESIETVPNYNMMADKSHDVRLHTLLAKIETKILNNISGYAQISDFSTGENDG